MWNEHVDRTDEDRWLRMSHRANCKGKTCWKEDFDVASDIKPYAVAS
jgi:hypothetical protein